MAALVSQSLIYKKLKENRGLGWGGGGEDTALTQQSYSFKSLKASVFFFPLSSPKLQRVIPSEGFRRVEADCISITSCVFKVSV